jgi:hypothetical protein
MGQKMGGQFTDVIVGKAGGLELFIFCVKKTIPCSCGFGLMKFEYRISKTPNEMKQNLLTLQKIKLNSKFMNEI